MRFGNFDDRLHGAVPEGQTRIAQRFSVGSVTKRAQVPKGRLMGAGQESNSAVPSGLGSRGIISPTLKRWAILRHPCGTRAWSSLRKALTRCRVPLLSLLCLSLVGCKPADKAVPQSEAKVNGNTVTFATNSPQLASLSVEPVGTQQSAFVPLSGRLMWNEEATVRVFTPFGGIVRKPLVGVNQTVRKGEALAEIQSSEFGQATAESRKAAGDFRRAERALARVHELFELSAAFRRTCFRWARWILASSWMEL